LVTEALRTVLETCPDIERVVAIGSIPMMHACCEVTRPFQIPTIVSLNSIMVDGTGMCGSCRVTVNGEMKFACIDGADFDGHLVNFEELSLRQKRFEREEREEREALLRYQSETARLAGMARTNGHSRVCNVTKEVTVALPNALPAPAGPRIPKNIRTISPHQLRGSQSRAGPRGRVGGSGPMSPV
jgi:hypothetical protein